MASTVEMRTMSNGAAHATIAMTNTTDSQSSHSFDGSSDSEDGDSSAVSEGCALILHTTFPPSPCQINLYRNQISLLLSINKTSFTLHEARPVTG